MKVRNKLNRTSENGNNMRRRWDIDGRSIIVLLYVRLF